MIDELLKARIKHCKKLCLKLEEGDADYAIDLIETLQQLILSGVVRCVCKIPEPRLKVSENGTYAYCEKCAKTYVQI